MFLIIGQIQSSQADPFIFGAEKDGVNIKLFGMLHPLPLNTLPDSIVEHIKSYEVLITENKQALAPLTKDLAEKMNVLRKDGEDNYYYLLDAISKKKLSKYADAFLKYKNSSINIDELNIQGLFQAYIMGHMVDGMDYSLLSYFKEEKLILGLEDLQEVSQYFESLPLDFFKEGLQVDFGFGSQEDHEATQAYIEGHIPADIKLDEEIQIRNLNWMQNILTYHKEYGEKAIICVGYMHLFGKFGLLAMLEEEGFKITRANDYANFLPVSFVNSLGLLQG